MEANAIVKRISVKQSTAGAQVEILLLADFRPALVTELGKNIGGLFGFVFEPLQTELDLPR